MTTPLGTPSPTGAIPHGRLVRLGWSEEYSPPQLLLAALVAAAPAAFVACLVLAGGGLSWWWLVLAPTGLALLSRLESVVVLVLWLGLGILWLGLVPGPFSWWCVPAALVLLVSHAALALLSGRPTAGGLAPETARRTTRRCAVVAGATVGVAALSRAVLAVDVAGQALLVALALAIVAAWWWWAGVSRSDGVGTSG